MKPKVSVVHAARPGSRRLTAEALWAIPRVGALAASPDGASVAVTVTSYSLEKNEGTSRIWLLGGGGAAPRPLTSPDGSCGSPAFSPDGSRLAFTRKAPGGKPQLWVMPVDGGAGEPLTDLPFGVFDPHWLPDGSSIVFGTTLLAGHVGVDATRAELDRREKDPVKAHATEDRFYRYWDTWLTGGEVQHLFTIDLASRALHDLTPDAVTWFDFLDPSGQLDVSPDGREVAYSAILVEESRASLVRSAIFTVPLLEGAAAGPVTCLTPGNPADDVRPRYTPDGAALVYGMQVDPFFYADRVRLVAYRRATGTHEPLLPDWSLSPSSWEIDASGRILLLAEDRARVSLFALEGGTPRELLRGGSLGALAPGGGQVYVTMDALGAPAEVHRILPSGGMERLSSFAAAALDGVALGEVQEWLYEGAKGETVQMFVVMPPDPPPGPLPLVHVIHGGPHGISGDTFHYRWNAHLFAAAGQAVALVNFQGSTSFGQDYAKRIQGAWAERPFEDVMRATDELVAAGVADPARMAAAGGSYGGYLAAWIACHTDRFRCVVNHAGVFDTLTQYASDVTQGRAQSFGGEPWGDLAAIDGSNPARTTAGCRTPMLVIHGAKDYRVPADQGLECYGILKAKGVPARLLFFPDENHWILKPQNSLRWYREVHGWLARWLC